MLPFTFTQLRLAALQPSAKRTYYRDAEFKGLQLCIQTCGARSYFYVKTLHGRPIRTKLGSAEQLTIEQARDAARIAAGIIAKGEDPRRAVRGGPKLCNLWETWRMQNSHLKPKTRKEYERQYQKYLGAWKLRPLETITKRDVQGLHSRMGVKHGAVQANRTITLLSSMFRQCGADVGYMGPNPCAGIRRFRERSRDRFLSADELHVLLSKVDSGPRDFRDFVLLALLTGARKSNVLDMQWQDLDLDRGLWRIPETKSGLPVVIPLVQAALDLLQNRDRRSEYVFPVRRSGFRRQWMQLIKHTGIQNFAMHDLRRTCASLQAIGGSSLPVIAKSLGHGSTRSTEIYARLSTQPVLESLEKAATLMLGVQALS